METTGECASGPGPVIPRDYITEWREDAPWVDDAQVEQDLVISKALVDIFAHPLLGEALAFRGGTALYKLYIQPPARYSEDIDLVQVNAEPAGPVMEALREVLNPWLGEPRYKQTAGRVTFTYRFDSEATTPIPLRLKVEINTREHFTVDGFIKLPFEVSSRWYSGACNILTYNLNELLGTKLRALYQRSKGRDLFDLAVALEHPDADSQRTIEIFGQYMDYGGHRISRSAFLENLADKLDDRNFGSDIGPLLSSDYEWDLEKMSAQVVETLIAQLHD